MTRRKKGGECLRKRVSPIRSVQALDLFIRELLDSVYLFLLLPPPFIGSR